ncbi:RNA polymerase sigma factor [Planctomyces sp. SH-PL62]|uniref:RNA polymerase sigma factor n=1 Tax=Planctomyces sp. SH-PL62 TaxID=1636152 RepID=UPI00078D5DD2|nr:RNA polymerase sigma factor [Planctomyces sp. SH-PL62]AMV36756.1 ECF RNA polymerase sigma factor SigE [Planctomyces sp. SH-PL62]
MSTDPGVATRIQTLFESGTLSGLSGRELLDRFATHGDQAAFEAIVARYGPMVLGVCRRLLRDPSDVDDAFQATFLVLVRRARSLGTDDVVAAWLHGVASRVARRARADRSRREARMRTGLDSDSHSHSHSVAPSSPDFALKAVIDEEIERLPWKYRAPVALCYLEGLTHESAASRLGWPLGTVKGRLARARSLLGSRLTRRGVSTSSVAIAGSLALDRLGRAAVPNPLRLAVVRAALRIVGGSPWRSVVSLPVVHLAQGVLTSMIFTKLKSAGALVLAFGLLAAGAQVAARQPGDEPRPDVEQTRPPATRPEPEVAPMLQGFVGRVPVSTPSPEDRFLDAARRAFLEAAEDHAGGRASLDRVYRASRLLLDAQKDRAETEEGRKAAFAEHLDRMRVVAQADLSRASGDAGSSHFAETRAMLAEAELWIARGQDERRPPQPRDGGTSDAKGDPSDAEGERNPKSAAILKKLDQPLAMNFPNETPLEDVLKYVRQATQGEHDAGIPIYVDPLGLNEADKTTTSPISIDLDGVPLRRTLQLLLKQLTLVYFVEDGMVVITSTESGRNGLGPEMASPSPLEQELDRASRGEMTLDELKAFSEKLKAIQEVRTLNEKLNSSPPFTGGGIGPHSPSTPSQ